jgi:hypothetical protein
MSIHAAWKWSTRDLSSLYVPMQLLSLKAAHLIDLEFSVKMKQKRYPFRAEDHLRMKGAGKLRYRGQNRVIPMLGFLSRPKFMLILGVTETSTFAVRRGLGGNSNVKCG